MRFDVTKDYDGPIISLKDAKQAGEKYFFTGKRCRYGHLAPRYIHRPCVYCQLIKAEKQRLEDPQYHAEKLKEWRAENVEHRKEYNAQYRADNLDRLKQNEKDYYANNPGKRKEKSRKWTEKHPEYSKQKARRLYLANPEKYRAQRRDWCAANPEKIKEYRKRDHKNNPNTYRDAHKRRRAIIANAEGEYTESQLASIFKVQGGKCWYCKSEFDVSLGRTCFHAEHMYPLVKGGTNWADNIVLACPHCNQSKHDLTYLEYLTSPRFSRWKTKLTKRASDLPKPAFSDTLHA